MDNSMFDRFCADAQRGRFPRNVQTMEWFAEHTSCDWERVLPTLYQSATEGDAAAQLYLGLYCMKQYNASRDTKCIDDAIKWLALCADQRCIPRAYFYLAQAYSLDGTDLSKQVCCLQKGVDMNEPDCLYRFGEILAIPEVSSLMQKSRLWCDSEAAVCFRRYMEVPKEAGVKNRDKDAFYLMYISIRLCMPGWLFWKEQVAWNIRIGSCLSDDKCVARSCVALLRRLLVRAVSITRDFRLRPSGPFHQRCVCKDIFVRNILQPACVFYSGSANVTISPPLNALYRAYDLGMNRLMLTNGMMTRAVWHAFLLDDDTAMLATSFLCTHAGCSWAKPTSRLPAPLFDCNRTKPQCLKRYEEAGDLPIHLSRHDSNKAMRRSAAQNEALRVQRQFA